MREGVCPCVEEEEEREAILTSHKDTMTKERDEGRHVVWTCKLLENKQTSKQPIKHREKEDKEIEEPLLLLCVHE